MPHLRMIGHLETIRVAGKVSNLRDSMEPVLASPARVIELRRTQNADGTGEIVSAPLLKDWVHMRKLLNEIQQALATPMLGLVYLEMLPPLSTVDWKTEAGEYFDRHYRLHLPIATNPGAFLLAGGESASFPVGMLTAINVAVPHCAANFGATPRFHLVVDVQRVEPDLPATE